MTTEELQQFEEEVAATLANPDPSGEVSITITDQQMNAYLANNMDSAQTDPSIQDPQAHFTDGKVEIYGKVSQSSITVDAKFVLVPEIDAEGRPDLRVESINLGPLPVPDTMVQQVDERVDGLLDDYLSSVDENFTVKDITVTEGKMTVTGVRQ
jgi:uncharacterized protein YpmS